MNFINRLPEIFGMRGQDVGEAEKDLSLCISQRPTVVKFPKFP